MSVARQFLESGRASDGVAALRQRREAAPNDSDVAFALGAMLFVHAVEELQRDLSALGAGNEPGVRVSLRSQIPIFSIPVAANPNAKTANYTETRQLLERFSSNLRAAAAMLDRVGDVAAKFEIDLAVIGVERDGIVAEGAHFGKLIRFLVQNQRSEPGKAITDLNFAFDAADASWLKGYVEFLDGITSFLLAFDFSPAFDAVSHVVFGAQSTAFGRALLADAAGANEKAKNYGANEFFALPNDLYYDGIALLHTINWTLVDRDRLIAARDAFRRMARQSATTWGRVRAETDDDREWLPSPRQTGRFPGIEVTDARIVAWLAVMEKLTAVLDGKLLLAISRFEQGIDVDRFVTTANRFDLLLFVTGPAAYPMIASGQKTDQSMWKDLSHPIDPSIRWFSLRSR
jgi:hypothetical protein